MSVPVVKARAPRLWLSPSAADPACTRTPEKSRPKPRSMSVRAAGAIGWPPLCRANATPASTPAGAWPPPAGTGPAGSSWASCSSSRSGLCTGARWMAGPAAFRAGGFGVSSGLGLRLAVAAPGGAWPSAEIDGSGP